jgi:TetR/AcrR family transcriptional regulator, repressor for uid operon
MMDNMQTEAQPTRTRILNAAREIFSENGFHSASMKAICKSCAISPGTLYHHFISKEALIQAIILQDQERALARFREPIEGIHFVDYMVESIVSLTHEAFGQRALVVEIMAEGMRNPQVAAMLKNKHMTITEFVAQRMRDAQQKGEISPDINTAMTSRLLLACPTFRYKDFALIPDVARIITNICIGELIVKTARHSNCPAFL